MYPSTKTSTIGGFVGGGSAGTGSIEHLTTSDGYVVSATVAPMDGSGELFTVSGADLVPFIHTYGVTGVLVEVEVRTDPARDWTAVYAAFDSYAGLAAGLRAMGGLDPLPRLVSGDEPALVPTLPASVDLDPRSYSLRVIAVSSTLDQVRDAVAGGGRRDGRGARRLRRDRPALRHVLQPPGLLPAARRTPTRRGSTWRPRAR